jgi:hypothetical protein
VTYCIIRNVTVLPTVGERVSVQAHPTWWAALVMEPCGVRLGGEVEIVPQPPELGGINYPKLGYAGCILRVESWQGEGDWKDFKCTLIKFDD